MVQMFSWFRAEAVRASWRKRSSAPELWATSRGRNLSATWRPRVTSSASYTTPMPPRPSSRRTLKCETIEPIKGNSQDSHLTDSRNTGQIKSREAERLAADEILLNLLFHELGESASLLIVDAEAAVFWGHMPERKLQCLFWRGQLANFHRRAGDILRCVISRVLVDILVHHDRPEGGDL